MTKSGKKNKVDATKIIDQKDMEIISKDKSAAKKTKAEKKNTESTSVIDDFKEDLSEKYKDYKIIDIHAFKEFLLETKNFLFATTLDKSKYIETNQKELSNQIKKPIKFGLISIVVTLAFFAVWSSFAPLDSASIAEGFIKLSANRKIIQHYEGGIVQKILVKDGDKVKKGQPLVVLNASRTKSELDKVLWQLRYAMLIDKRLMKSLELISNYQNDNASNNSDNMEVTFNSKYLLDTSDEKVRTLILAQKNSFNSYKDYVENTTKTFLTQKNQAKYEIKSLEERIRTYKETIATLTEEYDRKKKLYNKKLDTLQNLTQTKVELQRYKGQVLEDTAKLASFEHRVAEIKAKQANFMDEQNVKLSEEYKRNHTELLTLESYYEHAKDSHERTVIKAPNSGVVTDLQLHTVGGTIPPNGKILEIIPQDDNLIIEAFIPAQEIDSIAVGNDVRIQLNAYKARLVPRINGKVIYISADKFDKESPGMVAPGQPKFTPAGYYKAKIDVTTEEIDKVNTEIKLYPGMPVTVFIVKGTRSFAEYLYSPIKDSFHKAFKEP
jgi:HlyD family type I secretion membrane fusion protein